jgi:hypothetical protein
MPAEVMKRMRDWRKLTEEKQRLTQWDQPAKQDRIPESK